MLSIHFNGLILLISPNETKIPSGVAKIKVQKKMLNVIPAPLNKAGNISVMYFSDILSPIFLIKKVLLGLA